MDWMECGACGECVSGRQRSGKGERKAVRSLDGRMDDGRHVAGHPSTTTTTSISARLYVAANDRNDRKSNGDSRRGHVECVHYR